MAHGSHCKCPSSFRCNNKPTNHQSTKQRPTDYNKKQTMADQCRGCCDEPPTYCWIIHLSLCSKQFAVLKRHRGQKSRFKGTSGTLGFPVQACWSCTGKDCPLPAGDKLSETDQGGFELPQTVVRVAQQLCKLRHTHRATGPLQYRRT